MRRCNWQTEAGTINSPQVCGKPAINGSTWCREHTQEAKANYPHLPIPEVAGNGFAPVPPKRDASGITAKEFLRQTFEFEYCAECLQDAPNHTVVIGPTGHWFAMCKTQVVFRKWPRSEGGGVIAIFYNDPGTSAYDCDSYEHLGQHGNASLDIINRTTPAKPEEYAALKRELESAPYHYHLDVRQRVPRNAIEIRRRKTASWKGEPK